MTADIESIYHLPLGYQIERNGLVLTLTEEGWRAEVQHSMMRRCKGWDYCKPWIYLVTIGCQHHTEPPYPESISTDNGILPLPEGWQYPDWLRLEYARSGRPHLFGELAGNTEQEARIALNPFGKEVERLVMKFAISYPQVRIIEKVVMPNHVHILVWVKEQMPPNQPLGFIINKFKSRVNRTFKAMCLGLPETTRMDLRYQQVGDVTGSSLSAKNAKRSGTHPKIGLVFEAGYNDRILFRKGQLRNMIDYCRDNPRRLWNVVHNRQYFQSVSGIRLTMPVLAEGGTKGRGRWNGAVDGLLAPIECSQSSQTVTFTVIGNRDLLNVPERLQIQCSRSMSEADIETLKAEVLEACKHGVVPISPCISPGEKAIARAVMEEGHNLIALFPQGIPSDTTYKPYKQFFDACANGQLLILSPWEFKPGVNHLARWQCLFLNDIAMQLMVVNPHLVDVA